MTIRGLGVAAVFLVGCAVGGASSQLMVPKASAQQAATLTKWEYHGVDTRRDFKFAAAANALGGERWELVSSEQRDGFASGWFKRPKM